MKNIIRISLLLCLSARLLAQAPEKINYQAIVRDANNVLVASTTIGMQITILQGSATGTAAYVEKQNPTTNVNGLVNVEIGTGMQVLGNFADIIWANGPYFLKTEIDPIGGSNYTITGTSQLLSVPYALYSKSSGSSTPGPQGPAGPAGPSGVQGPAGNGFQNGTAVNQIMYWTGNNWQILNPGSDGQVLSICNGALGWSNMPGTCSVGGTVATLSCGTANSTGTLTQGIAASNVNVTIAYSGGNGGAYSAQSIASTGVSGLTANLAAGNFATGSGNINYMISGIPASSGVASFNIAIGSQTCSFTLNVLALAGSINALNCSAATTSGNLIQGTLVSNVNTSIPYTGGNGGTYTAQSIASTGVTGLIANLSAGTFANGSGSLTYTIGGNPATLGAANFVTMVGGQTCSFTLNVLALTGSISTLNCGSASTNGVLMQGTLVSNVNTSIPYTGGNGGPYAAQFFTSTGVSGLTANLSAGTFANGSGNLTYTITGNPASSGTAIFAITVGGQTCSISMNVSALIGNIGSLTCSAVTTSGSPVQGTLVSNVTASIPYTGGNGGPYAGQSFSSIGVSGLSAYLAAGTFANGSGNLVFTISGNPATSGTAIFVITVGGQTCSFAINVLTLVGSISSLNCGAATSSGTQIQGALQLASNIIIPFTGGNAGPYAAQSVASTGLTGLTANLSSGTFANGNGDLTYTISGNPATAGTAIFAITIGGQSCNISVNVLTLVGSISSLNCGSATYANTFANSRLQFTEK
ncbi:MAG: beta strand repeat-containing protein [Saprospiraceae bacterium]